MVLYCFKEEKSMRLDGAFSDVNIVIRIHHGLAERASDYTKKQFVFRLHTADQVFRHNKKIVLIAAARILKNSASLLII